MSMKMRRTRMSQLPRREKIIEALLKCIIGGETPKLVEIDVHGK